MIFEDKLLHMNIPHDEGISYCSTGKINYIPIGMLFNMMKICDARLHSHEL